MLRTRLTKLRQSTRSKLAPPPKIADGFYQSERWRAFVDALIVQRFGSRRHARCEDIGCRYPTRCGIRLFGDHIVERRDGGADFDPANILFRCGSCHTRKTAAERAKRMAGGRVNL